MPPFTMIADRIKFFRALRKKTQVSLANEASIDYRHFQKLEAGQSDFKISTIFKLSQALAIPACHLLQRDPFDKTESDAQPCPVTLLNYLPIGLAAWDTNGRLLYCNQQVSNIFELSLEEARQKLHLTEYKFFCGDGSTKLSDYVGNIIEGKAKSDFARMQIKLPHSDKTKSVNFFWNQALIGKNLELKGYVAAIWQDTPCVDLSALPYSQSKQL